MKFIKPEAEITYFETMDVVETSGGAPTSTTQAPPVPSTGG